MTGTAVGAAAAGAAAAALRAEPAGMVADDAEMADYLPFISCLALAIWLSHIVHVRR